MSHDPDNIHLPAMPLPPGLPPDDDFPCCRQHPTEPTYTASEVKVLTETATKVAYALGRKDALAEALEEISGLRADEPGIATDHAKGWNGCVVASAHLIRNLASQPPDATSDATSGVPGHQEVSEAVRSPQEPGEDA